MVYDLINHVAIIFYFVTIVNSWARRSLIVRSYRKSSG